MQTPALLRRNACLILLGLLAISSCRTAKNSAAGSEELRVMTYNIHHGNQPDKPKGVIDLDSIANIIRRLDPHLVALQELDSVTLRSGGVFQLKALADKLGMHYYYGHAIPYEGGAYGLGILSRYPIKEAATHPLPKVSTVRSEDRILALVKVQLPQGKECYFGATHLDVVSEQNRQLQVEKIRELTSGLPAPVILGGDFNAVDTTASVRNLLQQFTDASQQKHPTIPVLTPRRRIDYIVYSKGAGLHSLREQVPQEHYASDHLPFFAALTWSNIK
ncbi:MAG: endonuclease/exonuclease/phosphatase family protein [Candidatus Pseudobacter hemicellulosilyticus]|uniref:Endonuclease/exonuclease/phosphatase family protein n=1 Tax=Candidatus Pseudobacter hemicellulosilyticus TaxID=3121375 RepID=A0AAJ5WSR4_9BACT|nr:MAG: endonuclease/exonuclease/phosphatase family protein [Pseudobacter sp.]